MLRALVGPTASGKTEAAIEIAERLGAEIVSVDSMLVYRGMDVGTAKPTPAQRARVSHHLLDLAEPSERFTVSRFQAEARSVLQRVGVPLVVGGSGLYFRAVVDELEFPAEDADVRAELVVEAAAAGSARLHRRLAALDPAAAAKIEPANTRRIVRALEVPAVTGRGFSSFSGAWGRYEAGRVRAAGVEIAPEVLSARILERVGVLLEDGWLREVEGLVRRGFGAWLTSTQAIGYAELTAHLEGSMTLDDARETIVRRTRALARRQRAWFRRDPRIRWFEAGPEGAIGVARSIGDWLAEPG